MKYELKQTIYYLRENRMHSASVCTRMNVENVFDDWCCTDEQKEAWQKFGVSGIKYVTCHGVVDESEAYASKEELRDSLV
jgi:hypothetical protein